MIAASPLSSDEYAMRIATQTESALICKKKSTRPHSLSLNSGVPGTTENAFSDGQALQVHTVQGVVQTDHHPCSLLATVKHDIVRPVAFVVCLVISPAVCCLFLLACKTMYRSSAGVVPRGRPLLNPG
ncbi:uncharacterized protein TNCV_1758271 [Trichonephila clavipes]|nr:uncharacterized protein TNCV_1758271 [Trichonephila clavipes]